MESKNHLKTVRFKPKEASLVEEYLEKNQLFDSFSALARVATLSFIAHAKMIKMNTVVTEKKTNRLAFLWDYDITETEAREILGTPGLTPQKKWLMERILCQSKFDEILDYLNVEEIKRAIPHLKLAPKIQNQWAYALKRWGV